MIQTAKNEVFFNLKQNGIPENLFYFCFNGKWPGKLEFPKNMRVSGNFTFWSFST